MVAPAPDFTAVSNPFALAPPPPGLCCSRIYLPKQIAVGISSGPQGRDIIPEVVRVVEHRQENWCTSFPIAARLRSRFIAMRAGGGALH